MRAGTSAGALGAAGKWFTAILTSLAAVVALLVNAQSLGLTSWIGASEFGFAGYAARRVLVTPKSDSLLAIGDTAVLAATVTDRRGAVLVGVPLVWNSDDTTVVSVDSSGAVVARGPGVARITAEVREHRATATILVRQKVARIAVTGDSTIMLPEADTTRVSAMALDARGHRVRAAPISWISSDTFAVTVDSLGRVHSRAPGRAVLSAISGGRQGDVRVEVLLTPFRLSLVEGSGQHAATGKPLVSSIVVEAQSRGGLAVPGVEVLLSADGGTTESERVRTDGRGRARAAWTLGAQPGRQTLRARVAGIDSAVTVIAEADPVAGMTRVELTDSTPTGMAGSALNPPVILRITDPAGVPLPDVPVSWSVIDGGSVIPIAPRTDSLGQVIGRWTLGGHTGRQRIKVQVGDARSMPAFTVTANATAGRPTQLIVASGGDQRATVGRIAAQPLVLVVRDSLGNPVPKVAFEATATAGTVSDSAPVSDKAGRISLHWTAGEKPGVGAIALVASDSSVRLSIPVQSVARPTPFKASAKSSPKAPAKAPLKAPVKKKVVTSPAPKKAP